MSSFARGGPFCANYGVTRRPHLGIRDSSFSSLEKTTMRFSSSVCRPRYQTTAQRRAHGCGMAWPELQDAPPSPATSPNEDAVSPHRIGSAIKNTSVSEHLLMPACLNLPFFTHRPCAPPIYSAEMRRLPAQENHPEQNQKKHNHEYPSRMCGHEVPFLRKITGRASGRGWRGLGNPHWSHLRLAAILPYGIPHFLLG